MPHGRRPPAANGASFIVAWADRLAAMLSPVPVIRPTSERVEPPTRYVAVSWFDALQATVSVPLPVPARFAWAIAFAAVVAAPNSVLSAACCAQLRVSPLYVASAASDAASAALCSSCFEL